MKIHGLACFETTNGLTAIGSGRLSYADQNTELFEFRSTKLGGSEYLSANVPTAFFRKFYYRGILAHLVGIVKKSRDNFGRVGFWGVAAMVDDDEPVNVEVVDYLFGLSEYVSASEGDGKADSFKDILAEYNNYPPGELSQYEGSDSLVFSVEGGILSDAILKRSKVLIDIEPTNFSTVIVQLGKVANFNLGELSDEKMGDLQAQLLEESADLQAQIDFENLATHEKKFIERTEKLGITRPPGINAEFEDYFIALIRYVNNSLEKKKRR